MEDLATTPTLRDGNVVAWFEDVGPARAQQLIATYKVDYRKYRPTYAEGLSRDMVSGHWNFDGSPMRVDEDGNFFDGNHRAHAVIISGTVQRFLFVAGLPVKSYDTTDTGLARSYRDNLRRRGFQNVSLRSALIKLIDRWQTNKSLDDGRRMTSSEMDEVHDKYVDSINRSIQMAVSTAKKVALPSALVSFAWWTLSEIDHEKAYTFMVSLAEGENIQRGQPVYTLRERLRMDVDQSYTRNDYMHLVFTAWNAFVEDREITRIVMPSGFVTREKMAKPHD